MLRPQYFYNKSYAKSCYWWVKKYYQYLAQLRINNNLPHQICCKIIVNVVALLLFLLNPNFCNSQVKVFKNFIRQSQQVILAYNIFLASVYIHFFCKSGWSCDHSSLHVKLSLFWTKSTLLSLPPSQFKRTIKFL